MSLTNPDPTDSLGSPSHAALHTSTNSAIASLGSRIGTVEGALSSTADDIEQARRVANTWVVPGKLTGNESLLILPVIWNLTARAVDFEAAIASVLVAPNGGDVIVDIVLGENLATGLTNSILQTPLVITDGDYTSGSIGVGGFQTTVMQPNTYVAVVVREAGPLDGEGYSLTVQLNRLL